MGQQERKMEPASFDVFADLMGKLQQQAAEPAGDGFSQRDAASVLEGKAVFLADALDGAHLGFLMGAQKAEEPVALNRAQLGGSQRLSRDLVDTVREDGVEAQHGTGTCDPDDHLAVLGAPGGQLDIATAYEVEATGFFALGKEGGFPGKGDGAGSELEIGKDGAPKRAEPSRAPVGASRAPNGGGPVD
jgi:hypothetical protein